MIALYYCLGNQQLCENGIISFAFDSKEYADEKGVFHTLPDMAFNIRVYEVGDSKEGTCC